MESDFSHEGALYTLDHEPPCETISPFRRLFPERVPDRAFCVMELVLWGPAASSRPEGPQGRVLIHRSHTKLVLVHRYVRDCTGTHTSNGYLETEVTR